MQTKIRSGQVGLLLLVVMGLVVGIALSLASRSLSDTVLSRQESESAAAFRLAESGVEQALNSLRQGDVPGVLPLTQGDVFAGSTNVIGSDQYGLFVREGEQAHLDVEGYSGNLAIQWTKLSDTSENVVGCDEGSGLSSAAVEIIAHKSDATAEFDYYNPSGCGSIPNNFEEAGAGTEYRSSINYSVPAQAVAIRIRPIYNNATVSVSGVNLSTQLYLIQSEASGGDAQKEIEVRRGLDAAASVFDYALFSGSSIEK